MREGKYAIVAMREGPQSNEGKDLGSALSRLTKEDIGDLAQLAKEQKVVMIRLSHETPTCTFYKAELEKFKRIEGLLWTAYSQKP